MKENKARLPKDTVAAMTLKNVSGGAGLCWYKNFMAVPYDPHRNGVKERARKGRSYFFLWSIKQSSVPFSFKFNETKEGCDGDEDSKICLSIRNAVEVEYNMIVLKSSCLIILFARDDRIYISTLKPLKLLYFFTIMDN